MEKQAYTVLKVAALTGFSRNTVIRMFERKKGVLILGRPESMHKRSYRVSAYDALCMSVSSANCSQIAHRVPSISLRRAELEV